MKILLSLVISVGLLLAGNAQAVSVLGVEFPDDAAPVDELQPMDLSDDENIFQNDYPRYSITKSADQEFTLVGAGLYVTDKDSNESYVSISAMPTINFTDTKDAKAHIDYLYATSGFFGFIQPEDLGDVDINGVTARKFELHSALSLFFSDAIVETFGKEYLLIFPYNNHMVGINYQLLNDDEEQNAAVDKLLNSFILEPNQTAAYVVTEYTNELPYFKVDSNGDWLMLPRQSGSFGDDNIVDFKSTKYDYAFGNVEVKDLQYYDEETTQEKLLESIDDLFASLSEDQDVVDILDWQVGSAPGEVHVKLSEELNDVVVTEGWVKKASTGDYLMHAHSYSFFVEGNHLINVNLMNFDPDDINYVEINENFLADIIADMDLNGGLIEKPVFEEEEVEPIETPDLDEIIDILDDQSDDAEEEEMEDEDEFETVPIRAICADPNESPYCPEGVFTYDDLDKDLDAKQSIIVRDTDLGERVRGKIILKVEDRGRAYYINPLTNEGRFLGQPQDAFQIMREEGVGITDEDLDKIPFKFSDPGGQDSDNDGLSDRYENAIGTDFLNPDTDGDGYLDKEEVENGYSPWGEGRLEFDESFADRHRGKIFLKVEGRGEAWYVNPDDGMRYFLGSGEDAYRIMRELSLGISNDDFAELE